MPLTQKFAYIFSVALGSSILVYLLRGFQVVTFLPGGILLVLILLAIASGFTYSILITKR
jgi:hypothetical protein